MKTFTDNAGRTWTIAVNVDAMKRVKGLLGVDLMEAVEGKLLERLSGDPVLLCDVVYALVKPQADQASVSDEDFGRSMAGDAIDLATAAFLEELVDFFPSRRRSLLKKAVAKLASRQEIVPTAAEQKFDSDSLDRQVRQAVTQALLATSSTLRLRPKRSVVEGNEDLSRRSQAKPDGPSSGNSPESSAATPGR